MDSLHKCKLVHCHLSSRNVFIQQVVVDNTIKYNIKLGDLGDLSIRQSLKVFGNYDIRNTWSSPELLEDCNLAFSNRNVAMDIYSYGMLLWEIFSNVVPFGDNINAAKQFVVEKNFRPKIKYMEDDEDDSHGKVIPEEIAEIIKKCWVREPDNRPQWISDISERLKFINYD